MVEAVTTFIRMAAYQALWGSFNKRWQMSLTRAPHPLYYVCHLRETFQRDTAEMASCWLYLVASFLHVFIIVYVKAIDQWPLTALDQGPWHGDKKLSSTLQACFLTAPAYWPAFYLHRPACWPAFWLYMPSTGCKLARLVLIRLNG